MSDYVDTVDIEGTQYDIQDTATKQTADENAQEIEGIKTGNDYSLSEINTGKKWIDNKPIYRKVIQVDNIVDGTPILTNVFVINSTILNYRTASEYSLNVAVNTDGTVQSGAYVFMVGSEARIFNRGSIRGTRLIVILEYTKTTD